MPPEAYALVTLFAASSVILGVVATRVAFRFGGSRHPAAYLLPVAGAFGAFYMIGHRLGLVVGPEVELFGFQVALLGDVVIGLAAALAVALVQAAGRRLATPTRGRAA